jgi:hypothetical protein
VIIRFLEDEVFLNKLEKQLRERSNREEMLLAVCLKPQTWMLDDAWWDFSIEWEYFNGPIIQICNVVEMVMGSEIESKFVHELRVHMIKVLEEIA